MPLIILLFCFSFKPLSAANSEDFTIANGLIVAPFVYGFEGDDLPLGIDVKSSLSAASPHFDNNNLAYEGAHCFVLDTKSQNEFNLNELILGVQLEEDQDWVLQYAWMDLGEEEHERDGVFVSYDLGKSFEKIKKFESNKTLTGVWYTEEIRLKKSAKNVLVKFAQYDNAAAGSDGVALDMIAINPISELVLVDFDKKTSSSMGMASTGVGSITFEKDTIYNQGMYACMAHAGVSQANNLNILQFAFQTSSSVATLDFHWLDIEEESHDEDGVFLSQDMGKTFVKIFDFAAGSHPDFEWDSIHLDLKLSSNKAIIQFREYDNSYAPNDGIGLDNISINASSNYIASNWEYESNVIQKNKVDYYIDNKVLTIENLQDNKGEMVARDATGAALKLLNRNNEYSYYELNTDIAFPIAINQNAATCYIELPNTTVNSASISR
jgi:hypothetical protein